LPSEYTCLFVYYEEPTLHQKFGTDYDQYCRNVNRWWPHVRGWDFPG
jgi:protein-S-isoprenylcysteine O-methyltransferase Ste14